MNDQRLVLVRRRHPSPLGELTVVVGPNGLRALYWPGESGDRVRVGHAAADAPAEFRDTAVAVLDAACTQLDEYFAGVRTQFDLPLDPVGTDFQLRAWEALRAIPYGETRSYTEQARAIGSPAAVRAVGAANGRNPISIVVPCHRVVGADGSLTGFGGGLAAKRFLLDHEARDLTLF